jgi:hypothetical protein
MIGFQDSKQANHLYGGYLQDLWCFGAFGVQLWNSIRSVDFLESLKDVDTERIGCTGASGGGTQTFFLSAIDERIKASVPVNMISKHMQGGCNCEIAPFLHIGTDNLELAALMAPRPMYLISCSGDWTKNTPQVEYPEILSIYELYGKGNELEYFYQEAEHNYNKKSREAAYNWFARKLQKSDIEWQEIDIDFGDVEQFKINTFFEYDKFTKIMCNADLFILQKNDRILALDKLWNENYKNASHITRTALQHIIGVSDVSSDDIATVYTENTETEDLSICKEIIRTKTNGEQIPVISIKKHAETFDSKGYGTTHSSGIASASSNTISSGTTQSDPKAAIIIHPEGKKSLFQDPKWNEILMNMIDKGYTIVSTDLFLTGEFHRPGSSSGRDSGKCNHFTTFNYSDDALRVQDIVTVYNYVYQNYSHDITIIGVKDATALCLAAMPFIDKVKTVALDLCTYNFNSEFDYLDKFYIPGFLSAGAFKTCLQLAQIIKLILFNADKECAEIFNNQGYGENIIKNISYIEIYQEQLSCNILS